MNESSSYHLQQDTMGLSGGPMQTFHVPQHHVTLSPNDVVMVSNNTQDSGDISNPNNNLTGQQFDQTIMMPMEAYPHHHHPISEEHLQQRYVYVDQNTGYVQQLQYKEPMSGLPIYVVTQSSEQMAVPDPAASVVSESVTFCSPPASPVPVQNSQQSYSNNEQESEPETQASPGDEWESERVHFQKVVATFLQYKDHVKCDTERTMSYVCSLSSKQRELLQDYYTHLEEVLQCVDVNQGVFDLVCSQDKQIFQNQNDKFNQANMKSNLPTPSRFDFDKLQAVLKQIVRDWTLEGERERSLCYDPIIEEVDRRFGMLRHKRDIRILIPGAGLARLAHELVNRNYVVEGNEFSLYMLFASNFILNRCGGNKKYRIHPWIHQHSNVVHHLDQIRPVTFPDIDPADISPNARFSMTAGDFLEIYKHPKQQEAWDCVVTCFFIDCANNIVSFIERIHGILKPGGVWISLGPLLYHYADMTAENSIEPSLDFLIEIIKNLGFSIDRNVRLPTKYTENHMSMLNYTYTSAFLCCTKLPTLSQSGKHREKTKLSHQYDEEDVDGKRIREDVIQ